MWGISSAGRAPALQAGCQEFESPILHNGLEYIRAHVSERKKNRNTNPRGRGVGPPLDPSVLFCRISLMHYLRGVAQFGRALALGARGRRFKSYHPDSI